jgi:hypothetical protein
MAGFFHGHARANFLVYPWGEEYDPVQPLDLATHVAPDAGSDGNPSGGSDMRRMITLLAIGLLGTRVGAAEPEKSWTDPTFDLIGAATWTIPTGDNDADWLDAYEIKGVFWLTPKFGVGGSWGLGGWSIDDESIRPPYALPVLEDEDSTLSIATMPIGASLYLRPLIQGSFSINLEAGVRYMIAWDDVSVTLDGESPVTGDDIAIFISNDGDVDGGWIGLLGADFEFHVSSAFYVSLGAGYQFDLSEQTFRLWNEPPRELSFEGIALRAGLGLRF